MFPGSTFLALNLSLAEELGVQAEGVKVHVCVSVCLCNIYEGIVMYVQICVGSCAHTCAYMQSPEVRVNVVFNCFPALFLTNNSYVFVFSFFFSKMKLVIISTL